MTAWPYWVELAVMFGLNAIGGILLAPFAERVPKWHRIVKLAAGASVAVLISATAGRGWFFGLLGVVGLVLVLVHGWLLPVKHGINGWTAEPREKYYALRGWKMNRSEQA